MAKYKEPNVPIEELETDPNVVYYKGYYVRKNGYIYNEHGHRMQPYKNKNGIWVVMLRNGAKRICLTVDRFLYQAFHQEEILDNVRVKSYLDHDYMHRNPGFYSGYYGFSEEPVFNVDDLYLIKTTPGGAKKQKEYKSTHMHHKQAIIDKRNEYMKHPRRYRREIAVLNWVLDKEKI